MRIDLPSNEIHRRGTRLCTVQKLCTRIVLTVLMLYVRGSSVTVQVA